MYKIIFFAYMPDDMEDSYNFDMLEERFDTKEDAARFIKEVEAPRLLSELIDEDDPADFSVDLEDVGDEEIDMTLYSYGEINSITEYKIKEV